MLFVLVMLTKPPTELEADTEFYPNVDWTTKGTAKVEIYSQGDLMASSDPGKLPPGAFHITIGQSFYDFDDIPADDTWLVSVVAKITKTGGTTSTCSKTLWVNH